MKRGDAKRWEQVSREKLHAFLESYPRPLERDVSGISDPPVANFYDWALGTREDGTADLEACLVACYFVADGRSPESGWSIRPAAPELEPRTLAALPAPPPPAPPREGEATYDPAQMRVTFGGVECVPAPAELVAISMTPLPPVKKVGDSFSCCGRLWSSRALMNHADNAHAGGDLMADEVFLEVALDLMVEDGEATKVGGKYALTDAGRAKVAEIAAKHGVKLPAKEGR